MDRKLILLIAAIVAVASTTSNAAAHTIPRTAAAGKNAVLPALMNAAYGGYTTVIFIENVSHLSQTAHITITYFTADGIVAGVGDTNTGLPLWNQWRVRQNNGHSFATGGAGWGVVNSDQELAIFVNELAPGSGMDGSSYTSIQVPGGTATTLYAPTIVKNAYGGYTTGIGLVNDGANSATVGIDYRDQTGALKKHQTVTVAANGYAGLYSGDPTLGLPDGFTGTATIVNTSQSPTPLGAIVNETGPGGQFSSYDAVAVVANTLYVPAAMHNAYGGYNTGIGLQNTGGAGSVTVSYYDASGTPSGYVTNSIPAFGYLGVYQGAVDGPPASDSGYTAVITSTVPLAGIVNEVAPGGAQSTSFNTETAGSGYLNFAYVDTVGGPYGISTGLALMNITAATLNFTLTYHYNVSFVATYSLSLPAHGFMGRYTPSDLQCCVAGIALALPDTPGLAGIANEAGTGTLMSYNGQ